MERKDFEIMAPVGSRESLAAAFQAGADSVYFGIGALNMRSKSANEFTINDLKEIAELCKSHGVKSYLTVNTVIYDEDISLMREIIDAAAESGISAVIASDAAVMMYCRERGMEVHLSTQLNISNKEALKFYAQFADVVVLARELNLRQVKKIYEAIQSEQIRGPNGDLVRIEMFCHGALCMAISGKCYLSLNTRGRSANRGACMQTCRRAYIVKDKERDVELEIDNEYIMSPKDLKTIGFIDLMMKAGVRVFKIEGRARGAEYVKTVVEAYDQAIRQVLAGNWNEEISKSWDDKLSTVYNRGFWNGYYLGQTMGEWSNRYGSQATERKIYAGKGCKYFAKAGVAEFLIQAAEIRAGDRILITGPTTGAVYSELKNPCVDGKPVTQVCKGRHVTFRLSEKIRENDKLYIIQKVDPLEE
ncbi:peptidase U32 family protein [Parasutterella muris]|uniref:peptidase U32 family protein n=2 Tax=Parasutterella TaxID=577310 RepID=UPI00203DA4D1|nr:peptidase U32 family protein [Parasutterella muris]